MEVKLSINKADIRPETNTALRATAAATASVNQHSICLDQTSFPLRGATEGVIHGGTRTWAACARSRFTHTVSASFYTLNIKVVRLFYATR